MEKNIILESLDKLSKELEQRFDTIILRKMFVHKSSSMYRTLHPIDNSALTGKENNVFGPTFPRLKKFNDSNADYVCAILVPTNDQGFVLKRDLQADNISFKSVVEYCALDLGIQVYDGGQIKMSYLMPQGMEMDGMYSSKDFPLSPDIYDVLGSVPYRRILYYL